MSSLNNIEQYAIFHKYFLRLRPEINLIRPVNAYKSSVGFLLQTVYKKCDAEKCTDKHIRYYQCLYVDHYCPLGIRNILNQIHIKSF